MSSARDYRRLRVFTLADHLAVRIYQLTNEFPASERYGLQAQLRRASVSYSHFLHMARGSATEARYLINLSTRLGLMRAGEIETQYDELVRSLQRLIAGVEGLCDD